MKREIVWASYPDEIRDETLICDMCGKWFNPSDAPGSNDQGIPFCSGGCYYAWQREQFL